jgi:low temperature requirement protein LtrA
MSSTSSQSGAQAGWRKPMVARDPREAHRQATFLELFFDLCFVVAVAQVAASFHHALVENHAAEGMIGFVTVFFAIWWAWMNFTWLASAYDNDDVPYRIAAFLQITGALILASGVRQAFEQQNFDGVFVGYAVMRIGLVGLWLRAAFHDPERRSTCLRYAVGVMAATAGWAVMFMMGSWPLWGWLLMAAVELAVPVWAELKGKTPWHPHHIAERYGLFTIIVLGESVLAATLAVQSVVNANEPHSGLIPIVGGGVLTVFALWWLYFDRPAQHLLTSIRAPFVWGYGHFFLFAAAAAIGAGLAVNVDLSTGHGTLGPMAASFTVTIPVGLFLAVLWVVQGRPGGHQADRISFPIAMGLILISSLGQYSILWTGVILCALVAFSVSRHGRWR